MKAIPLHSRTLVLLPAVFAAAALVSASLPVSARTASIDKRVSYVVFGHSGGSRSTNQSPCSSTDGCASSVRFKWSKAVCFNQERYAPIVVVWTSGGKVTPNYWPVVAPCSTGIQLWWNHNNLLTKAQWRGASDKKQELTRFPKTADGFDIFVQGSDSISGGGWYRNGKKVGSLHAPSGTNDVYWYGYTPPKSSPVRASRAVTYPPRVTLLGRNSSGGDVMTTIPAPSGTNDVSFAWYLPNNQKGRKDRGCYVANGTAWTSPPVTFGYLQGGALNSRITVPTCPMDAYGNLLPFNMVDFWWSASADQTKYVLSKAVPAYNRTVRSSTGMPQPPAGTDGLYFSFPRDDYQSTTWSKDGSLQGNNLTAPSHTRLAEWAG